MCKPTIWTINITPRARKSADSRSMLISRSLELIMRVMSRYLDQTHFRPRQLIPKSWRKLGKEVEYLGLLIGGRRVKGAFCRALMMIFSLSMIQPLCQGIWDAQELLILWEWGHLLLILEGLLLLEIAKIQREIFKANLYYWGRKYNIIKTTLIMTGNRASQILQ